MNMYRERVSYCPCGMYLTLSHHSSSSDSVSSSSAGFGVGAAGCLLFINGKTRRGGSSSLSSPELLDLWVSWVVFADVDARAFLLGA